MGAAIATAQASDAGVLARCWPFIFSASASAEALVQPALPGVPAARRSRSRLQEDEPPGVAGRGVQVSSGHVEGLAVGGPAQLALPDMEKRSRGSLG